MTAAQVGHDVTLFDQADKIGTIEHGQTGAISKEEF